MNPLAFCAFRLFLFSVVVAATFGCGQSKPPPAPDKATVEQEIKQLNEVRQKESGTNK